MARPRFGYLRVHVMLRREGWAINKKRVYRLYRLEGLSLRMKTRRRKRISLLRGKAVPATGPNQRWSMDFEHDQMLDGRAFRILTVIDQWSRESVSLEANFRLTGTVRRASSGRGCASSRLATVDHRRHLPRYVPSTCSDLALLISRSRPLYSLVDTIVDPRASNVADGGARSLEIRKAARPQGFGG